MHVQYESLSIHTFPVNLSLQNFYVSIKKTTKTTNTKGGQVYKRVNWTYNKEVGFLN